MKNYKSNLKSIFITYLDANNLYGFAMSKKLPIRGFRWMGKEDLKNWRNVPCFLEVYLEYPEELNDLHNDFPLAPERILVNKIEKLIPNLNDKNNYVLHHEILKCYERLGLKITKIHRGITFEESDFMKKYIDLNNELRTKAKTILILFLKSLNNSVYGKTMENIRNRVDIRFCTNKKQVAKLINKPNFERRTIFCENFVAVHMIRKKILFNKPIYLGASK